MTDRSDSQQELDAAIARLVADAGADAPGPPSTSVFIPTMRPGRPETSGPRRLATLGAIGLAAAALAALVLVVLDDGRTATLRPVDTSPSTSPSTDATHDGTVQPTSVPEVTGSSAPASVRTTTSVTTTSASTTSASTPAGITRPVIEAASCEPVSAREAFTEGLTLFARPSTNPVPIQVIGDPAEGLLGPFAVVQRFFGDGRRPTGVESVEVDGTVFWISLFANANGNVEWDIGDGSLGYVRSRGIDRAGLLGVLAALTPRPADAAVPGFDYSPAAEGRQLLHEQMNTDVNGEVGSSECIVASTGYRYRISAVTGDAVFQYGGVIDRPVPLEVGTRDGTLIVIDGVADPSAPTVGNVIDADPATWLELRSRPGDSDGSVPRTESISESVEVVIPLTSVDDSSVTSYLTLRLKSEQGVSFLEVDTADAVLAPDAAFWRTDIDGGGGGISTARVGGVHGFRLGDAPVGVPIDVTIDVIDGGEFVLQTTGVLRLVPV